MSVDTDLLEKVEAELLRRADGSFVESWSEGRGSIQTMSITELHELRERLERRVARAQGTQPDLVLLRVRPRP